MRGRVVVERNGPVRPVVGDAPVEVGSRSPFPVARRLDRAGQHAPDLRLGRAVGGMSVSLVERYIPYDEPRHGTSLCYIGPNVAHNRRLRQGFAPRVRTSPNSSASTPGHLRVRGSHKPSPCSMVATIAPGAPDRHRSARSTGTGRRPPGGGSAGACSNNRAPGQHLGCPGARCHSGCGSGELSTTVCST